MTLVQIALLLVGVVAGWVAVAVLTSLFVGTVIRRRDAQRPGERDDTTEGGEQP